MDLGSVTENALVTGSDGGRGTANLVYILYLVGFLTGVTALVGVVLAYTSRERSQEPFTSHLAFQIRVFWRGVVFLVAIVILNSIVGAIGVATVGVGFVLEIIPIGVGIWWLVWAIRAILRGMGALGRREAVAF
jgi:uncharacterized membrane protein